MRRTTFDKLLGWIGTGLGVALLAAGGLLLWGSAYVHNTVQGQLAAQQITFPPAAAFAHPKAGTEITPSMIPSASASTPGSSCSPASRPRPTPTTSSRCTSRT